MEPLKSGLKVTLSGKEEKTMKIRNKKLAVGLMSFALVSACGAGFAMTSNTLNASAATNPIAFQAGASVRVAGRVVDGVEQVTPAIRFSLIVDESIVESVGTTTEIGMIIVPETYITAYNDYVKAFVATEEQTAAKDYYDYFTTESKCISFVYDSQDQIATVDADDKLVDPETTSEYIYTVRGAVDQVSVLTREYVAIAYTASIDGTNKVYADATSLARSVAYVSSAALNDNQAYDVLPVNVQKGAYEILGTEYNAEVNPFTDNAAFDLAESEVTLKPNATVELATENLNEFSIKYTSSAPEIASVDEKTGEVTALKAGTATITAKIGDLYERTCAVTVADEYAISVTKDSYTFAWATGYEAQAEKTATYSYTVTKNGEAYTGDDVNVVSNNTAVATVEGNTITAVADGTTTITISVGGATETIDVRVDVCEPITTKADMDELAGNTDQTNVTGDKKYMLMADIDYNGEYLKTICSRYTNGFNGVFDGNGHTISNFTTHKPSTSTNLNLTGVFGIIGVNGVVRNLNVVNVTLPGIGCGGIASTNNGTIENCFVQGTAINDNAIAYGNPIGGVVAKNAGVVRNCIAVLELNGITSSTYVGGIAGYNDDGGNIENCYSITSSENVDAIAKENSASSYAGGTATNCVDYDTLADFYANVTEFDGWTFENGYYPHYGDACAISVEETNVEVQAGGTYQIEATSNFPVYYEVKDEAENVTVSASGLVTVGEGAEAGQEYVIVVKSLYGSATKEVTITIPMDVYEIALEKSDYTLSLVTGYTTDKSAATYNYTVTKNGVAYTGDDVSVVSNDTAVATVNGNTITAVGDGTTTVEISVGGATATVNVKVDVYTPITSIDDMNNLAGSSDSQTVSGKYMLMNNIDYVGGNLKTISRFTGSGQATKGFTGIFDGNGYTISNFTPVRPGGTANAASNAIFGNIASTGIVRNLNVAGVTLAGIANGGIANFNFGTIENCFVQGTVTVTGDLSAHPVGGIVAKNQNGGTVRNCVAVLTIEAGVTATYIGGVAGWNATGAFIENCYSITSSAVNAISASTTTGGTATNCVDYADLSAFYATEGGADLTAFTNWTFDTTNKTANPFVNVNCTVVATKIEE